MDTNTKQLAKVRTAYCKMTYFRTNADAEARKIIIFQVRTSSGSISKQIPNAQKEQVKIFFSLHMFRVSHYGIVTDAFSRKRLRIRIPKRSTSLDWHQYACLEPDVKLNEDKFPEILLQRAATAKDVPKRIHDGY